MIEQFTDDVRKGKGGDGIFLDPWWLYGPRHEITVNKRLWDLGAELVENIPHSSEVRAHRRWRSFKSVAHRNLSSCAEYG